MAKSYVAKQLAVLKAAYPREQIAPETLAIYATKLEDIDPTLLAASVNRLIEDSRFFPAIAEVRHMAARLAGLLPPHPAEMLAMIRRADVSRPVYRQDGSLAYTEHEWDWDSLEPGDRDFCQAVLERVGDPMDFASEKKHFGWENGLQKVAESMAGELLQGVLANLSQARLKSARKPLLLQNTTETQTPD